MMVITSKVEGKFEYSCMYDPNNVTFDVTDEKNNLYGLYGCAFVFNENKELVKTLPAIVWFNKDMKAVKGEIHKCCANCKHSIRSKKFFLECINHGSQITNEQIEVCEQYEMQEEE